MTGSPLTKITEVADVVEDDPISEEPGSEASCQLFLFWSLKTVPRSVAVRGIE